MSSIYRSPDAKGGPAPSHGRPSRGFSAEPIGNPSLVMRNALERYAQVREARAREIGSISSAFNDTLSTMLRDVGALKGFKISHDLRVQGKLESLIVQAEKVRADFVSGLKKASYNLRIPGSVSEFIRMANVMLETENEYFMEMKGTLERLTGALTATTNNEAKLIALLPIKPDEEVRRLEKDLARLERTLEKMREPKFVMSTPKAKAEVKKTRPDTLEVASIVGLRAEEVIFDEVVRIIRATADDFDKATQRHSEMMRGYQAKRNELLQAISNKRAEISAAKLEVLAPCEEESDRLARLQKRGSVKFDSMGLNVLRDAAEKALSRARGYITWLEEKTYDRRGLGVVNKDNVGKITDQLGKIIDGLGKLNGKQGSRNPKDSGSENKGDAVNGNKPIDGAGDMDIPMGDKAGIAEPGDTKKQGEPVGPFEALYSGIVGNASKLDERLGKGEETKGTDRYESQAAMRCENQRAEMIRRSLTDESDSK